MAVYEFKCKTCGSEKLLDTPINKALKVPVCCGSNMRQLYSPPAVIFRGTGWGAK